MLEDRPTIAVVGPTRPYRGGIVEHTALLAEWLAAEGRLVELAGWAAQFPRCLYRGGTAALDDPTTQPVPTRELHWARPWSWRRVGSRLARKAQNLIIVVSTPLQVSAVRAIAAAFRARRRGEDSRVIFIVHNVIPHERMLFDRQLTRLILRVADVVIVHSPAEAELAEHLGAGDVRVVPLPFHPPAGLESAPHPAGSQRLGRLAFLGFVRPYKGLDLVLNGLAQSDTDAQLIVQGEFWEPIARYEALIEELGLADRIELRPGYASTAEIVRTLAEVDALVLPYRSATASQQARIAFARGVPVIATAVGTFPAQVRDEVDGLIVPTPDSSRLAAAIEEFYHEDRWLLLRSAVRPPDSEREWDEYLEALA